MEFQLSALDLEARSPLGDPHITLLLFPVVTVLFYFLGDAKPFPTLDLLRCYLHPQLFAATNLSGLS